MNSELSHHGVFSVGIFNASHDEALEAGIANFTPSKTARQIERDLALLPYWGFDCNAVLVSDVPECERFLSQSALLRRDKVLVASPGDVPGAMVEPWGWDKALLRKIAGAGLKTGVGTEYVDNLSRLQNRRFGSEFLAVLLGRLRADKTLDGLQFAGESKYAETYEDAAETAELYGKCVLKRPVSGSGRGIMAARFPFGKREADWCKSSCSKAGGIEVQRYCEKIADFAMEFHGDGNGGFEFDGYSEFCSSESGGYTGNYLSEHSRHGSGVWKHFDAGAETVKRFEQTVAQTLGETVGNYRGFLGMDMMVCKTSRGPAIFPCVEMNFRRTMGMLANSLGINAGNMCTAWFRIIFKPDNASLLREIETVKRRMPLVKSCSRHGDERFLGGYLPLTPIGKSTLFHACMVFSPDMNL